MMPEQGYISAHLLAAWRMIVTARGDALRQMDVSPDGFWLSFWSIAIAFPAMAISWIVSAPDYLPPDATSGTLPVILALAVCDIASWLIPLALLAIIAPRIGMAKQFAPYVIATNWGSALLVWLVVPPTLLRALGPGAEDAAVSLSLVSFMISIYLGWRITHGALGRSAGFSAALVFAMLVASIIVLLWMQGLLGLGVQA